MLGRVLECGFELIDRLRKIFLPSEPFQGQAIANERPDPVVLSLGVDEDRDHHLIAAEGLDELFFDPTRSLRVT